MPLSQRAKVMLNNLARRGDYMAQAMVLSASETQEFGGVEQLLSLVDTAAKGTTNIAAALAANNASNNYTIAGQPDVPRNLRVVFASSWDGGNVVVVGKDQFGAAVTETFTSNPGNTVVGVKIFASVTSATKGSVGATANAASIGTGDKLACGTFKLANTQGALAVDGASEVVTLDKTYHAFTPTTVPNGTHDYELNLHASNVGKIA